MQLIQNSFKVSAGRSTSTQTFRHCYRGVSYQKHPFPAEAVVKGMIKYRGATLQIGQPLAQTTLQVPKQLVYRGVAYLAY